MPTTIVAEVCYMVSRYRFGSAAEAAFLRSFTTGDLVIGNLVEEDFERMAQLVEQDDNSRWWLGRQCDRHRGTALDHDDPHRRPAAFRCCPPQARRGLRTVAVAHDNVVVREAAARVPVQAACGAIPATGSIIETRFDLLRRGAGGRDRTDDLPLTRPTLDGDHAVYQRIRSTNGWQQCLTCMRQCETRATSGATPSQMRCLPKGIAEVVEGHFGSSDQVALAWNWTVPGPAVGGLSVGCLGRGFGERCD